MMPFDPVADQAEVQAELLEEYRQAMATLAACAQRLAGKIEQLRLPPRRKELAAAQAEACARAARKAVSLLRPGAEDDPFQALFDSQGWRRPSWL